METWLKENNCDLNKLAAKFGLPQKLAFDAAEIVYQRVKDGEEIPPIKVGWQIRAIALTLQKHPDAPQIKELKEAKEREARTLETEWAKLEDERRKCREDRKELDNDSNLLQRIKADLSGQQEKVLSLIKESQSKSEGHLRDIEDREKALIATFNSLSEEKEVALTDLFKDLAEEKAKLENEWKKLSEAKAEQARSANRPEPPKTPLWLKIITFGLKR